MSVTEYPEPIVAVVHPDDIAAGWGLYLPHLVELDMEEPIELIEGQLLAGHRALVEMKDQLGNIMALAVVGKLAGDLVVFGLGRHGASYWISAFARLLQSMAKADECEQVLVDVPPGWMGELVTCGFVANRVSMTRVVNNGTV